MPYDILGYLQSKGVPLKNAGPNNVHTACWYCGEDESKRGRLYINTDPEPTNGDPPGLHMCHLCGTRGAFNKIRKHFGDPIIKDDDDEAHQAQAEAAFKTHEILQAAAEFYHESLEDAPEALTYLKKDRGLTIDTIIQFKLGWANGGLRKFLSQKGYTVKEMQATGLVDQYGNDFLQNNITIPYITQGNVVYIRGKDMAGKYLTPPGQKTRLFNSDATWDAEQLVVTEGEFDAMTLVQLGFAACASPGANVWQDSWSDYFSQAKRVFICFDNDNAGHAGAEKVARAIGPHTRIVKMPDDGNKNDPNSLVVEKGWVKADFDLLFIQSKGGFLLSVDDCYAEWAEVQSLTGLELGYEVLDKAILPGLLPSQVMVVLAKSGVGKTIFLLNVFERMLMVQPKLKILFVSLEQTRGEWFERARRIHRFYNLDKTDKECLDYYRDKLWVVDKNQLSEGDFLSCIEQFEYEVGQKPDVVAIDYLGYWARSFKGERYERTSDAIMSLKALAKETRISIITPHQVGRNTGYGDEPDADAARDSGVIEETSDFLFTLWSTDNRKGKNVEERTGEVNLRIGKSRHGGKGVLVHLQFAPHSLVMVPKGDPLAQLAIYEHHYALMGDNYAQSVYRHRTGIKDVAVPEASFL